MDQLTFPLEEKQIFLIGPAGKIEVKAASTELHNPKITVVICHPHPLFGGTMENKVVTTIFRTFKNMGAAVLRFNYRGVGKSEGQYDEAKGETDDLISVCNWVKTVIPNTELWLAGFSFGSYIAAHAAKQLQAMQLITIAPAVEHFNFDILDLPECPWLVLQGETDEIVPPELVYNWVEKNEQGQQKKQLKLITFPDTSHFFHGKLSNLKEVLENEYRKYFV